MYKEKIAEIRSRGLMLAIEFNPVIDVEKLHQQLFEEGFVVGLKERTLRFMPPLTIEYRAIDALVNALENQIN